VDLATGEIVSAGIRKPKKALEKPVQAKKNAAFARLVAAARRLLDVVYKNEGLANKDLARFEAQIQNLTDKWDK
jgi:metallo-beta-lactamase family protein